MKKFAIIAATGAMALGLSACDIDQTEEGELPDVDVEVDGGNLPEFDVETADVDVGTEEVTVDVPTVDVDMPDDAEGEPVTGNE